MKYLEYMKREGLVSLIIILFVFSGYYTPVSNISTTINDPLTKLQGGLDEYINTGIFPDNVNEDRLMVLSRTSDILTDNFYLRAKIGDNYIHFINKQTPLELREIAINSDVITVLPDIYINQTQQSIPTSSTIESQSFASKEILGLEQVWSEYNVTGDGIILGIIDSGVDFGLSDLADAPYLLPSGITASFDATGNGLAYSSTTVQAIDNLGKKYLPLSDKLIYGRIGETGEIVSNTDIGIPLDDIEITNISKPSVSGNYRVGMIIQYGQTENIFDQFFIFVLSDSSTSGVYDTMYIDYDTSLAITLARNGEILANSERYLSLIKWSLNGEVPVDNENPIAAKDVNGDGINDISAGALATTLVVDPALSSNLYVRGIEPDGKLVGLMYDTIGHGTYSTSAAAGRGINSYPIFDDKDTEIIENNTLYALPGSAPNAKILATKWLTVSEAVLGWLWAAGMEFDSTGQLTVVDQTHLANMTSNSWGIGNIAYSGSLKGLDYYSLLLDLLSAPDLLYNGYPGMIFVVSMGNGGSGTGTIATPATASMSLAIGASTNYNFLNSSGRDDVAWFSSKGPTPYGLIKPDLIAPGNTGYVLSTLSSAAGNGTYSTSTFGGTSEAGPRAAGVVAIMMEALVKNNRNIDLGTIRTILKSTAKDLGYHASAQGAGLIDAYKAVSAVYGSDDIIISTTVTSINTGRSLEAAFKEQFGDFDHPLITNPVIDTFITVNPENVTDGVDLQFSYGNGTAADISGINMDLLEMVRTDNASFSFNSLSAEYTNINLASLLPTDFRNSDMLQISLSLDETSWDNMLRNGVSTPDMILYDAARDRIVFDIITQRSWLQQLYSGNPADDFIGDPVLRFTDPGYTESIPGWTGLKYSALAQTFDYTPSSLNINKQINSVTIDGDINTSKFLAFQINSQKIPVFITVIDKVGLGDNAHSYPEDDNISPYEMNSVYGTLDWGYRPENGDFRFYEFLVPSEATYFALQASWQVENMIPDLYLFAENGLLVTTSDVNYIGGGIYDSSVSEPNKQNLFVKADYQRYYLLLHFAQMPFIAGSIDFDVFTRYLTLSELPVPQTSFSQDLNNDISGDLEISAINYSVDQFPELYVDATSVSVVQGSNGSYSATIDSADYNLGFPDDLSDTEDRYLLELKQGEKITLDLSWMENVDLDLYVFDPTKPLDIKNDMLGLQGAISGKNGETASFSVPADGVYVIAIDLVTGFGDSFTYTLSWNSLKGPVLSSLSNSLVLPTNVFPNGVYGLQIEYSTNFDVYFDDNFISSFSNHLDFTSKLIGPIDGKILSDDATVSWEASKSVLADISVTTGGVEIFVDRDISDTSMIFDTSLFENGDAIITVYLTDGIYSHVHSVSVIFDNDQISSLPPTESEEKSLPLSIIVFITSIVLISTIKRYSKLKSN